MTACSSSFSVAQHDGKNTSTQMRAPGKAVCFFPSIIHQGLCLSQRRGAPAVTMVHSKGPLSPTPGKDRNRAKTNITSKTPTAELVRCWATFPDA